MHEQPIRINLPQASTEKEKWADIDHSYIEIRDGILFLKFKGVLEVYNEDKLIWERMRLHAENAYFLSDAWGVHLSYSESYLNYRLLLDSNEIAVGKYSQLRPIRDQILRAVAQAHGIMYRGDG